MTEKESKEEIQKSTFIAYGADLTLSKLADDDEKLVNWYKKKGLTKKGYYLSGWPLCARKLF